MYFHTLTMMITVMAQSVEAHHLGGLATPMNLRNSLMGPNSGWNSMFHTAPTATREAT